MVSADNVALEEASISPLPAERFARLLSADAYARFDEAMRRGASALRGRTMWHVNATLKGGGVAEMLSALLPYVRGADIACRWVAVSGAKDFFALTKRLHNCLHGFDGDGGELGDTEARLYASTLAENGSALMAEVRAGDIVFVHDPQTAGLIPALKECGAVVIWHCHIGAEEPNAEVRRAWAFLIDQVLPADRYILSRADYLWDGMPPDRLRVVRPSIDAFSPKNQHLDPLTTEAILRTTGVVAGEPASAPTFTRTDGTIATVSRTVRIVDGGIALPAGVPVILQSARWDRLKDPAGVLEFFSDHLAPADPDVHLLLAGPSVEGISDDPEGAAVLAECAAVRSGFSAGVRERVHLLCSPMEDEAEAGAVVNALQRRADVVIQKSLAEGFGLVVCEAMWKERPVVSARVGGIQDQIEHGESGMLVDDASDGAGFAAAVAELLADKTRAREMGARARARVLDRFLAPRQLAETMDVVCELA